GRRHGRRGRYLPYVYCEHTLSGGERDTRPAVVPFRHRHQIDDEPAVENDHSGPGVRSTTEKPFSRNRY
ncbi:MAG: hypothetical protein PHP32_07685, partial [Candidatus Izemoplasmatales bacterium]|nr:hypothetical protein [Candidatus Izemoplasmatales bacterium]